MAAFDSLVPIRLSVDWFELRCLVTYMAKFSNRTNVFFHPF